MTPPPALVANRAFRRLFGAQVTSLLGSGVTSVALAAFAYEMAGGRATVVVGTALSAARRESAGDLTWTEVQMIRTHDAGAPRLARVSLPALAAVLVWTGGLPNWPALAQTPARAAASDTSWAAVDRAMGRPGDPQPGGVQKYSLPRGDLVVRLAGVTLKPALALGSWVAFKRTGSEAMVMGDLVLTEAEIAPVVAKLQQMGVDQTAIHHHVLHESPRMFYVHIHAMGDPVSIAEAVRSAVALTKTPPAPAKAPGQADFSLDTTLIAAALGHGGKVNGGVYQVSVPRAERITDAGMEVPSPMGLATALNFQPTGGGKAASTGDFVLTDSEVGPVMRALRKAGIEVTALHNHLLRDEPRLFFMHFWANTDATALAKGLRTALDLTNSKKPAS